MGCDTVRTAETSSAGHVRGLMLLGVLICSLISFAPCANESKTITDEPESFDQRYKLPEDAHEKAEVPKGRVYEFYLSNSVRFPGTERRWWLYVPPHANRIRELPLMVFQDGALFVSHDGPVRIPTVLNNLIGKREVPIMAAVFLEPGVIRRHALDGSPLMPEANRSMEYDSLGDHYANFLIEEILPRVRQYVSITDDPHGRAIVGLSSGAICAFTVAWERPDQFRKVVSGIGSFTRIRGGQVYPSLIGSTHRKPIRIFIQSGAHDLVDAEWGDWREANREMAASLNAAGYDYKFEFGEGGHSAAHLGSIFPEAMRWLWRDYPR